MTVCKQRVVVVVVNSDALFSQTGIRILEAIYRQRAQFVFTAQL
jgi:hypothetical protein